jgi:type II secretory pathway component GspD/PulD (secretin)
LNRAFILFLILVVLEVMCSEPTFAQSPSPLQKIGKSNPKSADRGPTEAINVPLSKSENQTTKAPIESDDFSLMSINYINVDIREALSALAMQREINIVAAPDVSGMISVHLYGVTLPEALNAICLAGGFKYTKQGDLYYVRKPSDIEDAPEEEFEMRVFKLNYAEIDKVQEILGALPDIRVVKIHEPTRTVIVEDTLENIRRVATIIQAWDAPPEQVMIEAKILEIRLTDDMVLGVDWDKILNGVRLSTSGFSNAILPNELNPEVAPAPRDGLGIFSNFITGAGTGHQFAYALDALRTKTSVNGLSTPRVLAISGRSARVQVGGQQGYRLTTVNQGISTESIEFIDTGIVLDITPYIDDDHNILLNVKPSITSAELEEGGIPVTNTALVSTWLLVKNGETAFIGGLIQDSKFKTKEAVPILGSIPGLGVLFGRNFREIDKTEIVVLITPRIIDDDLKTYKPQTQETIKKFEDNFKKEPLPDHQQALEILRLKDDELMGPP